jgi:hypothetical protein
MSKAGGVPPGLHVERFRSAAEDDLERDRQDRGDHEARPECAFDRAEELLAALALSGVAGPNTALPSNREDDQKTSSIVIFAGPPSA